MASPYWVGGWGGGGGWLKRPRVSTPSLWFIAMKFRSFWRVAVGGAKGLGGASPVAVQWLSSWISGVLQRPRIATRFRLGFTEFLHRFLPGFFRLVSMETGWLRFDRFEPRILWKDRVYSTLMGANTRDCVSLSFKLGWATFYRVLLS